MNLSHSLVTIYRMLLFSALPVVGFAEKLPPPRVAISDAPTSDAVAQALAPVGLRRRDLRSDPFALLASRDASGQLPLLRALLADPLKAGWRAGTLESRYRQRIDSPHRLLMTTVGLTGAEMARGYIGNPLQGVDDQLFRTPDPIAQAIGMIEYTQTGKAPETVSLPSAEALPNPLRREVARLLGAIAQAEQFRQRGLRKWPKELDGPALKAQVVEGKLDGTDGRDYRLLLDDVEYEALYAGALDLAAAVEDFDDFLSSTPTIPSLHLTFETALGTVVVSSRSSDDEHAPERPLLLIDLAGNDLYRMPETPSNPITIVIDQLGDDRYEGSVATGLLGYGILWDKAGNDVYTGDNLTQGAALVGAALLMDGGGDDVYTAKRASQSFAVAGAALLLDLGGDDVYTSLNKSQASGGPRGAASLVDASGADVYTLAAEPVVEPSAQLPERNSSMGQGAGWGLRADLSDGRSLAGGIGMLLDFEGNDRYEAQVICQGSGFLEGAGILVDGGGDDAYSAAWYGMAAGAHRGAGVLVDRGAGNDSYAASHYTSISAAHDGSITFLHDDGGNESYTLRHLGIGAAQDNGIAIFVDASGEDVYTVVERAGHAMGSARLSHSGTAREESMGIGLFLDLGGDDRYGIRRAGPGNNRRWKGAAQYPELALPGEVGAGLDGTMPDPFLTEPRTPPSIDDNKQLIEAEKARRRFRGGK